MKDKVHLPLMPSLPSELFRLYTSSDDSGAHFRKSVRSYNSSLAFASLGVHLDRSISNSVGGAYTPSFSQIYFMDGDDLQKDQRLSLTPSLGLMFSLFCRSCFKNVERIMRENVTKHIRLHIVSGCSQSRSRVSRQFNALTSNEIVVLMPLDETPSDGMRDIILHSIQDGLQFITQHHSSYDALHFVLLFPFGTDGWSSGIPHGSHKAVTIQEFYYYHLQVCVEHVSPIHLGGRLLQEYVSHSSSDIGTRVVLPSSYIGSPHHMHHQYQDAMAIIREFSSPDLFIMMTVNPNWLEVRRELRFQQKAADKPDLVSRVFSMKLQYLIDLLKNDGIFGRIIGRLHERSKPFTVGDYDRIVCAKVHVKEEDPELYEIVRTCMMHGPCGTTFPNAPCMKDGKCSKNYPRNFVDETSVVKRYVSYRRRENVVMVHLHGVELDNRWIVSYNRWLTIHFHVKYLYKYVYKGPDMITAGAIEGSGQTSGRVNEIEQFLNAQYFSANESCWRLLGLSMADDSKAQGLLYQDLLRQYWYNKRTRRWTHRINMQMTPTIGCMYFVHPFEEERFYMRDFLAHVRGATNFEDLRTADDRAILDVELHMQAAGKSLVNFGLRVPDVVFGSSTLFRKEMFVDENPSEVEVDIERLNVDQRKIFDRVVHEHVVRRVSGVFFVDGPGGTGKTHLYIASSGIAALLMKGGRTSHSWFKTPPTELNESSICNISKQFALGTLLMACQLIIWDEAPMAHKYAIECIDRSLRDILSIDAPFGGVPVIVNASLKCSHLWKHMEMHKLTKNMRVMGVEGGDKDEQLRFVDYLLSVGDGREPTFVHRDLDLISLTEGMSRAILAPLNKDVDEINARVVEQLPSEIFTFYSADSVLECEGSNVHPIEYLNSLQSSGCPPHKLVLKIGMIVMLLRSIASHKGLCNGTRLIILKLDRQVIEAEIVTRKNIGSRVLISRIPIVPSDSNIPFELQRVQFPIRAAFAMTINKAQGQTMDTIGLYLPHPVFSHGQLYVALSRVQNAASLRVLIIDKDNRFTDVDGVARYT
ncbi:hypothetical protein O6H91_01G050600 [Diphasiastrum complanatum]|uniref:Uncharacterized protein n=1 Tax=Diphasiastrum complanatum TaxID=34168 RepID=A0ACC2EQR0_DIPCM|nr:hypothetical protein O6H91_01G050600 [Diphasiastrum complanatum]